MSPRVPHRVSAPRVRRARVAARTGHALRALLVAFGLLFLQGPRLFHLLLVAHATCEHGELVELASVTTAETPAAVDAAPRDPEQDRVEAAHEDGAGHDHCDALALRHLPSEVGSAFGAPSLLSIAPLTALEPGDERRPVPVLALAPKSSPPVI